MSVALVASAAGVGATLNSRKNSATAPEKSGGSFNRQLEEIWREIDREALTYRIEGGAPADGRVFNLNIRALVDTLGRAPLESAKAAAANRTVLPLPMPDGSLARFLIEESPILEPALAAAFPEIKSYRGRGIDEGAMSVRCDWSPRGFHALVISNDRTVVVQPARWDDTSNYVSYSGQDAAKAAEELGCLVDETNRINPGNAPEIAVATGPTLRHYRIAVATTQEYTNTASLGGGSIGSTIASINTWLNSVNAIYERELSVRLTLVGNNNLIVYTAEPDPFTNGNLTAMIGEVPPVISSAIGQANFDIGHVFGATGSGAAGVASLGVVCNNGSINGGQLKSRGATLLSGTTGNYSGIVVWAHEIAHQFSADHTFNGTTGNCGSAGQRAAASAVEPGSGLTLMSYGGICGTDNISIGRDFRFHAHSYAQINNYIAGAGSCFTTSATGNNSPSVSAGPNYNIPRETPFTLTGAGSDPDPGDQPNLSYTWEQVDAGASFSNPPYTDAADPGSTTRPIFRPPALPSTNSSRIFPSLNYILSSANDPPDVVNGLQTADELPRIGRSLNFRVLVRDNRGGVNEASTVITVAGGSGPFRVTSPNTSVAWSGGSAQTVTWDVASTTSAPVNCANVNILLSTDGGNTFPIALASNTPNDGSQSVTVPNGISTASARIKVEAAGNIFFDICDANFTITPGDGCPAVSGVNPSIGNAGASVTISGANFAGVTAVKFNPNVAATITGNTGSQLTVTVPAGAITGPITISRSGCADLQTSVFTVCSGGPSTLLVDDGSVESALVIGSTGSLSYYVNRLTPPSYPATLGQVSIHFPSFGNVAVGSGFTLLVGKNEDGNSNIDNTILQTLDATVSSTGGFSNYSFPPVTIDSGDFVVGFRYVSTSGVFPAALDTTAPVQTRSYISRNGTFFEPLTTEDLMIRAQVFGGSCSAACVPPSISTHPATQTVCAGSAASFTVAATGSGLSYQWRKNGTNISGASSSVYSIASVVPGDAGSYDAVVTGSCGTAASNAATLTINSPPTIAAAAVARQQGSPGSNSTIANVADAEDAANALQVRVNGGASATINGVTVANLAVDAAGAVTADVTAACGAATAGFTLSVTDSAGASATAALSVTVNPNAAPVLSYNSPQTIAAGGSIIVNPASGPGENGSVASIAVQNISPGSFSGNISVDSVTGVVSISNAGPQGTYTVAIRATDNCGAITDASFLLNAGCTAIAVDPPSLPGGTVGVAYSQPASATGGTSPYAFSIVAGALPPGLALNTMSGAISGSPASAGTFNFTIRATDANNCFGERDYSIVIIGNGLVYYALPAPIRLLDTRPGESACSTPGSPLGDNAVRTQTATGACTGIPSTAKAVVGNATVVNFISTGFHWITLFPSDAAQPNASNLNFSDNQIVPNQFTVGLGADGAFKIYSHAPTHFIVDITGYYAPPAAGGLYYHPLPAPVRIFDSRPGETACDAPGAALANDGTRTVLAHRSCLGATIPSSAKAVVGNATVVNFISSGFNWITLYPFGTTQPNASNLNFTANQIVPNAFVTGLSGDGKFNIYSRASTHFIVDVNGYFSDEAVDVNGQGLLYNPLPAPVRLLDTRPGEAGCDAPGVPLGNDAARQQSSHRTCFGVTIPSTAKAVVGNATVVNFISTGFSWITLYPFGAAQPNASNLNYSANQIVPNAFVVGLSNDGKFNIYSRGSTHFIVDLTGYFAP